MPKRTFLKLPEAKRNRILNVAIDMVLTHPIQDITISHIVKHAQIPRGSFYQYFKGIEDLLFYLYQQFIEAFERHTIERLHDENIDIFVFFKEGFEQDYTFFTTTKMHKVYATLMEQRKFVGLDLGTHERARMAFFESMLERVDTSRIDHLTPHQKLNLYMLYVQLKNNALHRVISQKQSYDEGKEDFLFYINILERGALDEKHL